jgi:hypothetical protein
MINTMYAVIKDFAQIKEQTATTLASKNAYFLSYPMTINPLITIA